MDTTTRAWDVLFFRGLLALVFGTVAFVWPGPTLGVLMVAFGIYVLADGVLAVVAGSRARARRRAVALGLEGILGIALAVVIAAFAWSHARAAWLVPIVGAWAIATAALELAAAARLQGGVGGEPVLGAAGIMSALLGIALLTWPSVTALVLLMLLGVYGLLFGAAMMTAALRARPRSRGMHETAHVMPPR